MRSRSRAVQVRSACRAQAAAILGTERLHRQSELKLLAQQIDDVEQAVAIVGGRQILVVYFALPFAGIVASCGTYRRSNAASTGIWKGSTHRLQAISRRVNARPVTRKVSSAQLVNVHRQIDRRGYPVVLVLRVERGRPERPLDVLPRAHAAC